MSKTNIRILIAIIVFVLLVICYFYTQQPGKNMSHTTMQRTVLTTKVPEVQHSPEEEAIIAQLVGTWKSTKEVPLIGEKVTFENKDGELMFSASDDSDPGLAVTGTWSYMGGVLRLTTGGPGGMAFNIVRFDTHDELFLSNSGTPGEPADDRLTRQP